MEEIFIDNVSPDTITHDYLSQFYKNDTMEISFLFKSDFNNAKYLRDDLMIILDIMWLDSIWKNRFVLIIDELNNNAIEYGSNENAINVFKFIGKKQEDGVYLNIEVEDEGNGKNAKKSMEMENLRHEKVEKWFENYHSIRGRGLFLIITKLVDELYFKDSQKWGLIVGVKKTIKIEKD